MIMGPGLGLLNRRRRAAAASYPLLNNLVAYWNLDEASGQRNDSHTSGLHLTDNNTVTSATGPDGGTAASFVRANSEYLSRASSSELHLNSGDWTIATWVYLTNKTGYMFFVVKAEIATRRDYQIYYDIPSDRLLSAIFDGTPTGEVVTANNYGSPATTTWLFVVSTYTTATKTLTISVNNGAANSAVISLTPGNSTAQLQLGYQLNNSVTYHNGRMAYVGFWKRVLTAAERTWLWNSGNGRPYSEVSTYTG